MKHINESIIGRRGAPSGRPGLWTLDILIPVNNPISRARIHKFREELTRGVHYVVDDIEPYLCMESNLAGIRGEKQAVEEARKYMEHIKKQNHPDRFSKYVGITRPYSDDELKPLERDYWDYIIGLDDNDNVFAISNI